jgi:hypothetical protein
MFVLLLLGLMPRFSACRGPCDPPPGVRADAPAALLWIAVTSVTALALVALTDLLRPAAGWRSRVRDARASLIAPHQWRFPI